MSNALKRICRTIDVSFRAASFTLSSRWYLATADDRWSIAFIRVFQRARFFNALPDKRNSLSSFRNRMPAPTKLGGTLYADGKKTTSSQSNVDITLRAARHCEECLSRDECAGTRRALSGRWANARAGRAVLSAIALRSRFFFERRAAPNDRLGTSRNTVWPSSDGWLFFRTRSISIYCVGQREAKR